MSPLSICLYVSTEELRLRADDQLLRDALLTHGVDVRVAAWDHDQPWSDIGVICSTWDYTNRWASFSQWLDRADRHCRLINPLPLLRRSLDKRHLLELVDAGVAAVPTVLVGDRTGISAVREEARRLGWDQLVIKPLVSAGGRQVYRATPDSFPHLPDPPPGAPRGWLLQPLLSAIGQGEYSHVSLAGHHSHTVLKRPAPGEFRVQSRYGGQVERVDPPCEVTDLAGRALEVLGPQHTYARVDIVVDPHLGPLVMEVEMLEPDLFLRLNPEATNRYALALIEQSTT